MENNFNEQSNYKSTRLWNKWMINRLLSRKAEKEAYLQCFAFLENFSDTIKCSPEHSVAFFDQSIQQIRQWLQLSLMDPDTSYTIITRLQSCKHNFEPETCRKILSLNTKRLSTNSPLFFTMDLAVQLKRLYLFQSWHRAVSTVHCTVLYCCWCPHEKHDLTSICSFRCTLRIRLRKSFYWTQKLCSFF